MKKISAVLVILSFLGCENLVSIIIEENHLTHKNWYVHPDSLLNSIQAALDSCRDGDTVTVAVGTYHENIVWPNTSGIYLRSEAGPEQTVIDGGRRERVIMVDKTVEAVIDGFTIQNGYGNHGSAIRCCGENVKMTIVRNIIRENWPDTTLTGYTFSVIESMSGVNRMDITENEICYNDGLAIFVWSTELTVNDNRIHHNRCGIWCESSPVIIYNNTLTDNEWGCMHPWFYSAGIGCYSCPSPIITDNTVVRNTDNNYNGHGGGISLYYCGRYTPALIKGNTIDSNYADWGGGVYIMGSNVEIQFNSINANRSWHGGAGLYIDESQIKICGCIFNYNSGLLADRAGDGIRFHSGRVAVSYCEFINNSNYGILNDSLSNTVDARLNWWGDASGPAGAGPGIGDSVSVNVIFDPWLTEPWSVEKRGVSIPDRAQ